jgi:hypothetical protein
MKITATRGTNIAGVEGYQISCNGHVHPVIRYKQQFTWTNKDGGRFLGTIKEIKALIIIQESTQDPEPEHENAMVPTWDCVDPLALLILIYAGAIHANPLDGYIRETVDCKGRLLKDGSFDVAWADRELKRYLSTDLTKETTNEEHA